MRKALALTASFLLAEPQLTLRVDAAALSEDLARRFAFDTSLPPGETLDYPWESATVEIDDPDVVAIVKACPPAPGPSPRDAQTDI
jgi:hypothetical protein